MTEEGIGKAGRDSNTCSKSNQCTRDEDNPARHVVLLWESTSVAVEYTEHNIDEQRDDQGLPCRAMISPHSQ